MNVRLQDKIKQRLTQADEKGGLLLLGNMRVSRHEFEGTPVLFSITHPKDAIQMNHVQWGFYEAEELEIIRAAFPKGGRFVDIGANVGNHSLFVALFLEPKEIIPIEPNPVAYKVFVNNMLLNKVETKIDMSFLGMGLSDTPSDDFGMIFKERNIGGGRMAEGKGAITTILGDDMVGRRKADFIKIDVEGMEIQVLRSLEKTVNRDKPRIFIEVDNVNRDAFDAWVEEHDYRKVTNYKRYRVNENFLLAHSSDDYDV